MSFAPSRLLVPSSNARSYVLVASLLLVAMPFVPSAHKNNTAAQSAPIPGFLLGF